MRTFVLVATLGLAAPTLAHADEPAPPPQPAPAPPQQVEAKVSKVPAYIGLGVTVGCLVTAAAFYFKGQSAVHRESGFVAGDLESRAEWNDAVNDVATWQYRAKLAAGATILSGAITGFLWSRHESTSKYVTVSADRYGGAASLTGSF